MRLQRELGLDYTEGIDVGRGSFGIVKFWVVLPDRRCKRQDSVRRNELARDHPQAGGRSRRRCPPQQPQPEADWHGTPAVEHARVGGSGCQGDSGGDMRRMQLSLRAECQRKFSQSHVCSALSLIDLLRLALASDDAALGSAAASVNSRRLAELLRSTCHDELVRAALGRMQSTLCRMQMLKYRRLSCDCVTRSRSPRVSTR